MLDRILDMVGLPVLGGFTLILAAVVWYRLGNRAGKVALIVGAALLALRQYRENTLLNERVKQDEKDRKAVRQADDVRRESRKHSDAGGLRDDDGFRRD